MKSFLYIFFGDIDEISGVSKKVKGVLEQVEKKATNWVLFALSSKVSEIGCRAKSEYLLPVTYKNENLFYHELDNFLKTNINFDIIFFRYPSASKQLFELVRKYPNKIIFEHNTKEIDEIRHQAHFWVNKYKFKPTPSYLKLRINTLYKPIYIEKHYGKKILKLAKSGVCVTNEISDYEKSRYKNYKCVTIANGINIESVKLYNRKFIDGDELKLIMLVSSKVDWHGIDLILESFNNYLNKNIQLILVGELSENEKNLCKGNRQIIQTGFLKPSDFQNYLESAHVGLGSFALYRKGLEEASTLKVREYLASGLPVFMGHKDTDVESTDLKRYTYTIDIRKNSIDWSLIYKWAVSLYSNISINEEIRAKAKGYIDFSVKVDKLFGL